MKNKSRLLKNKQEKSSASCEGEAASAWWENSKIILGLLAILLLAIVAYSSSLDNGFTNWDDPHYVTENPYIANLSAENLKTIFTSEIALNYHPLTILSLALDYKMSKFGVEGNLEAGAFHRTNLLLHLFNIVLLFGFIYALSGGRKIIAFMAALLFAVHPMHVETVAWVSERKDVLYAFFFLAGLMAYISYLKTNLKLKYLLLAFLLFLFSCLSKPTAVLFPLVLLLLDYYTRRKWDIRTVLEKLPFFLMSLLFGLKTVSIQSGATIGEWGEFSVMERILFACYGLVAYLVKFIFPYQLTVHYAYPDTSNLPLTYYLAPLLVLLLAGVVAYSLKKTRVLAFGFLFYLVMNALTLQFVSVGSSIISERYSYMPFVGLYFMVGWLAYVVMERIKRPMARKAIIFVAGACGFMLMTRTYKQCNVWENSRTLWANAMTVAPSGAKGYSGMADYYLKEQKNREKALEYLDKAVQLNPAGAVDAYINRAKLYRENGKLAAALQDGNKAVEITKGSMSALNSRGNVHFAQKEYSNALVDFKAALDASGGQSYLALANIGAVLFEQKLFEKSIQYLTKALEIYPGFSNARLNLAFAYSHFGKARKAIQEYDRYLAAQPKHVEAHYWQAQEKIKLNQLPSALESLNTAIRLNPELGYLQQSRAEVYRMMGK